jgi:biotin-(acetyl-CoA carboxylase) ligase
MADAAEEVAGLPEGAIRLKWPNDLVVVAEGPNALLMGEVDAVEASRRLAAPLALRKLAGVLGESEGLGTDDPRVIVGLGINADWEEREFPAAIAPTMTSLRAASGGRPIDVAMLLDGYLARVEARVEALRAGFFDVAGWVERQVTTGHRVRLETSGGTEEARALGVDPLSGALVVEDAATPSGERQVHAAEVVHVRVADPVAV